MLRSWDVESPLRTEKVLNPVKMIEEIDVSLFADDRGIGCES